ncbi:hypothetical protein B0T10DRAFT_147576 [Thelonectria olida]|uniref:Uncharacterized protein n=1 Tax=Thelonectria olida TaxID=1576542 RepID=A0A9P8VWI4_9HYPO|nr:hypothetical protein B0T10DRAFT_147576 [Thelonectria olida]
MPRTLQTTAAPWGTDHEPEASITTKPPLAYELDFRLHGQVALRQEVPTVTCGYYSWTDSVWPWACESATTCKTIGGHFGCHGTVFTTCYPKTDFRCTAGASIGVRELCCTYDSIYPACVSGIKSDDGQELTAYNCGNDAISGELSIYTTKPNFETTSTTESETTETAESESSLTEASLTTLSTHSTSTSTGGDSVAQTDEPSDKGGSDTPIGPIVGGVVGGVALIALVVLAIWLIRRKKTTPPATAQNHAATMPPPPPQMSPQPQMQYSTPPQTYPPVYQPMVQGSPVGPGSPQSDFQRQSYQDGFVPTDQSQAVLKPAEHTSDRTELPTERHKDAGTPAELQ